MNRTKSIILILLGASIATVIFSLSGAHLSKYFDSVLGFSISLILVVLFVLYALYVNIDQIVKYIFKKVKKEKDLLQDGIDQIGEGLTSKNEKKVNNGFEILLDRFIKFSSKRNFRSLLLISIQSLFVLFGAIFGSILLSNQNELIQEQNRRLDQQTYLQEAERRSSLVFLFSNIMESIDKELQKNSSRKLSPQLIARIISLSQRLQPYRFLDGDELTEVPYSPERAQLFTNLVKSKIDDESLNKILKESNFTYSDFSGVTFSNLYIEKIDLSNSRFSKVNFNNSSFSGVKFSNVNMNSITLDSVFFSSCSFNNTEIDSRQNDLVRFSYSNLINTSFKNSTSYPDSNRLEFLEGELVNTSFYGHYDFLSFLRSDLKNFVFKAVVKDIDVTGSLFAYKGVNIDSLYASHLDAKNKGLDLFGSKVGVLKYDYLIYEKGVDDKLRIIFNDSFSDLKEDDLVYGFTNEYVYDDYSYDRDTISYRIGFNISNEKSRLNSVLESLKHRDNNQKGKSDYKTQLNSLLKEDEISIVILIDSLDNMIYNEDYLDFNLRQKYLLKELVLTLASFDDEYYDLLKIYVEDLVVTNTIILIERNASKSEHVSNRVIIEDLIENYIKDQGFYANLFDSFDDFLDAFEPYSGLTKYKREQLKKIYELK